MKVPELERTSEVRKAPAPSAELERHQFLPGSRISAKEAPADDSAGCFTRLPFKSEQCENKDFGEIYCENTSLSFEETQHSYHLAALWNGPSFVTLFSAYKSLQSPVATPSRLRSAGSWAKVPFAARRKRKVGGRTIHLPYMHAPLYVPIFPLFDGAKGKKK